MITDIKVIEEKKKAFVILNKQTLWACMYIYVRVCVHVCVHVHTHMHAFEGWRIKKSLLPHHTPRLVLLR